MESILTSVKKQLGIAEEYTHFDPDIIMHINTVFMILQQLGVGPEEGFMIEDELTTWEDFIPEGMHLTMVKTYVPLKVRLAFDPPSSSTHMNAIKEAIAEYEWRLNHAVDPKIF